MFFQQLEKSSGDLNTLTASLKATDGALQRELDSIKDGTNDLANKFSKLRDRINQEIANKQASVNVPCSFSDCRLWVFNAKSRL